MSGEAASAGEASMLGACSAALAALPAGLGEALRGKTVLATGCSGFFGLWTLACLEALRRGGVDCRARVASRDPQRFEDSHPFWARSGSVSWIQAEASDLSAGVAGSFDFALHMAASSDAATNAADPVGMIERMVSGSCAMSRLCAGGGAPLLMVSSGAVYGRKEAALGPSKESDDGRAPPCLDARQAYGQAKRAAEAAVACQPGLAWTVSRPFAFLGPHLPLDAHFAAGNFLRDAARGQAIEIKGDGAPVRSFMHPADLAAWQLWLMCLGPRGEAVNVGSDEAVGLGELAREIAFMAGAPEPRIWGAPGGAAEGYVPDISKARSLGLRMAWGRGESIGQCLRWLSMEGGSWSGPGPGRLAPKGRGRNGIAKENT